METNTLISPRILTGSPLSHALRKRAYGFVLPSSLPPVELRIEEQRGDGAHSESPYLPAAPNPYNRRPANDYWNLGARSPCWNLSLSLRGCFSSGGGTSCCGRLRARSLRGSIRGLKCSGCRTGGHSRRSPSSDTEGAKDTTGAQCEQWLLLSDSGALRLLVSSRALLPMTPVRWTRAHTAHCQHGHQLHGVRRIVVGWKTKRLGRDITGNYVGHGWRGGGACTTARANS